VADAADLAGIPLFASLTDDEREAIAPSFEVKDVSAGYAIASEGASGYSFYVLIDGEAVVTLEGETVATCGPGEFFGEMAILGDGRRYATVTTTAPSRLLSMFGTEFRRLQQEQPDVAAHLETVMRQRTQGLDQVRSSTTT
jgi:CRP-like cAMP-binding protein